MHDTTIAPIGKAKKKQAKPDAPLTTTTAERTGRISLSTPASASAIAAKFRALARDFESAVARDPAPYSPMLAFVNLWRRFGALVVELADVVGAGEFGDGVRTIASNVRGSRDWLAVRENDRQRAHRPNTKPPSIATGKADTEADCHVLWLAVGGRAALILACEIDPDTVGAWPGDLDDLRACSQWSRHYGWGDEEMGYEWEFARLASRACEVFATQAELGYDPVERLRDAAQFWKGWEFDLLDEAARLQRTPGNAMSGASLFNLAVEGVSSDREIQKDRLEQWVNGGALESNGVGGGGRRYAVRAEWYAFREIDR